MHALTRWRPQSTNRSSRRKGAKVGLDTIVGVMEDVKRTRTSRTFPMISGSMAEIASRRDEVFTESALNRNTPAAGSSIAKWCSPAFCFSFATIMKLTPHSAFYARAESRSNVNVLGEKFHEMLG